MLESLERYYTGLGKNLWEFSPEDIAALDEVVDAVLAIPLSPKLKLLYLSGFEPRARVLAVLKRFPDRLGLAAIASLSNDGYVREAALQNLIQIGDRAAPFVVNRAYDWAQEIHFAALPAALHLIRNASHESLLQCVKLVPAFLNREASEITQTIRDEATRRPGFLISVRDSLDRKLQTQVCLNGWKDPAESDEMWLGWLLRTGNERLVTLALDQIRALDSDDQRRFAVALWLCRSMPARMLALEIAERHADEDALVFALMDRHAFVRNSAREALKEKGMDFEAHYRERLPMKNAFLGLGEVLPDSRMEEICALLNHDLPWVQCLALKILMRRDAHRARDAMATMVSSLHPSVVRASIRAMKKISMKMDADEVENLVTASPTPELASVRLGAVIFVRGWEQFILVLRLARLGYGNLELDDRLWRWITLHMRGKWDLSADGLDSAFAAYALSRDLIKPELQAILDREFEGRMKGRG